VKNSNIMRGIILLANQCVVWWCMRQVCAVPQLRRLSCAASAAPQRLQGPYQLAVVHISTLTHAPTQHPTHSFWAPTVPAAA
jgi:hypothetical protein